MSGPESDQSEKAVHLHNRSGRAPVVVLCEHASNRIPARYGDLGLRPALLNSHIAWDPGALAVAMGLSTALDAPLVAGGLSRLLFDCNRPPAAPDAMPARSEVHDIPGNHNLSDSDRAHRIKTIHDPFRDGVQEVLNRFAAPPVMITVHSFTPVYRGQSREVEIGLIHDSDDRLTRAMMAHAGAHTDRIVRVNDPYGPADGVTHTLRRHALPIGALNVMLEIRNDLIREAAAQSAMAALLTRWITASCADLNLASPVQVTT